MESATFEEWVMAFESEMRRRFNESVRIKVEYTDSSIAHFNTICSIVCDINDVDMRELFFHTKGKINISDSRQIAMFLCFHIVEQNASKISRYFNRNHSTVLYAIKTVKGRLKVKDAVVTNCIKETMRRIGVINNCKVKLHDEN